MLSRQDRFLKYIAQTSEEPVLLDVKASEGVYLIDQNDNKIIDMISGIGVSNLGHGNQSVTDAIKNQANKYLHTMVYGEFVQSPQLKLAELLVNNLAPSLNSVFFVNSGSEAIEGALKLAKRVTKRSNIVAMNNAYHGSSHGALSLMSDPYFSNFYRPLVPGIKFMDFNSTDQFGLIDNSVAAVVVEPIQGEAGYLPANQQFLEELRHQCDQVGALLIFDEIQSGIGRTGNLFAYEKYQIVPDIICTAKALGAGMPIGAFISDKKYTDYFKDHPVLGHISTFGGHPVSAAASFAGLDYLLNSTLIKDVDEKEKMFREKLVHPLISKIDGTGLMLSAQLPNEPTLKNVVHLCLEKGLMIDWFLYADDKLRIAPPLIINKEEIEKACSIIIEALNEI